MDQNLANDRRFFTATCSRCIAKASPAPENQVIQEIRSQNIANKNCLAGREPFFAVGNEDGHIFHPPKPPLLRLTSISMVMKKLLMPIRILQSPLEIQQL